MIYSIGTLCIKKYFSIYTRAKSDFKFVEEFISNKDQNLAVIKTGFLIFTTVIYNICNRNCKIHTHTRARARACVYDIRGET